MEFKLDVSLEKYKHIRSSDFIFYWLINRPQNFLHVWFIFSIQSRTIVSLCELSPLLVPSASPPNYAW